MKETLLQLFTRDLNQLKENLAAYQNEQNIWKVEGSINNSAGNLALHLVGNINHFIGTILGKTDYVRNREIEFSAKDIPVDQVQEDISKTISMLEEVIPKLDERTFQNIYPINIFGKEDTIEYVLIHLATHLTYHLGQVNYHRRLLDT